MKKTYRFSIATQYVRSEYSENIELEFDDDATESEIEEYVCEVYERWLFENNCGGFEEI